MTTSKDEGESGCFLGFDPEGKDAFGVAVLFDQGVKYGRVDMVVEAIVWALDNLSPSAAPPIAAGIDILLHWSTGPSGWRPPDVRLRALYPQIRNSIIAPNGLRGAMAIGGVALALRLRERWPNIRLNETHPKVLLYKFRSAMYGNTPEELSMVRGWLENHTGFDLSQLKDENELDAVVSAWATSLNFHGRHFP